MAGSANSKSRNCAPAIAARSGLGRRRRRIRPAAQHRLQWRDHARRRQLSARDRPALAHQFGFGVPPSGDAAAEPDRHDPCAGQPGRLQRALGGRGGVDQGKRCQRRRRPRGVFRPARCSRRNCCNYRASARRICWAGTAFPSWPMRRRSAESAGSLSGAHDRSAETADLAERPGAHPDRAGENGPAMAVRGQRPA